LDIGVGTGFYLQGAKAMGACHITWQVIEPRRAVDMMTVVFYQD